jgi:hypothetical protein
VLDAGTGINSMRWLTGARTAAITAVTGSSSMAQNVRDAVAPVLRPVDRILLGDWADPDLLASERFDTVLADYLLGAIEGFAPYFQDQLFARLRPHVGGRLYVVGLEPYVNVEQTTANGRLIAEIGRLRDACLLLAGHRPYREYPLDWVLRSLRAAGYAVEEVRRFPIRWRARFVNGQMDMCLKRLPLLTNRDLAESLAGEVEALRHRALAMVEAEGGIAYGEDYVVVARPEPIR